MGRKHIFTEIRRSFDRMLPQGRVDPTADLKVVFDTLRLGLYSRDADPMNEKPSRAICRRALQRLLHHANVLNKFQFWAGVSVADSKWRNVASLNRTRETRGAKLLALKSVLQRQDLTRQEMRESLHALADSFRAMHVQFYVGRFDDAWDLDVAESGMTKTDLDLQRYMCAAVLPRIVRLFEHSRMEKTQNCSKMKPGITRFRDKKGTARPRFAPGK